MAPTDWRRPVRRSPLEAVHAALGAVWVADDVRWPQAYGNVAAERATVKDHAGIADIGPIDVIVVRGQQTPVALDAVGVSSASRSVVAGDDDVEAWCLGEDEAVVLQTGSAAPTGTAVLVDKLRGTGATVTDQSSGISVLRLVGPAAPAVLAEACAVDLSPRALAAGAVVQVPMAGIRVSVARQDRADIPGYTLLVMRDQVEYLWDSLIGLGEAHAIAPVGPAEASAA